MQLHHVNNFAVQMVDLLTDLLDNEEVEYDKVLFDSEIGIAGLGEEPFVSSYIARRDVGAYTCDHRVWIQEFSYLQCMLCMPELFFVR